MFIKQVSSAYWVVTTLPVDPQLFNGRCTLSSLGGSTQRILRYWQKLWNKICYNTAFEHIDQSINPFTQRNYRVLELPAGTYGIMFEAMRGQKAFCDYAIDDVIIKDGLCEMGEYIKNTSLMEDGPAYQYRMSQTQLWQYSVSERKCFPSIGDRSWFLSMRVFLFLFINIYQFSMVAQ